MIVVSANPGKIAPHRLSNIKVLVTYLNGKEIYRAGRQ